MHIFFIFENSAIYRLQLTIYGFLKNINVLAKKRWYSVTVQYTLSLMNHIVVFITNLKLNCNLNWIQHKEEQDIYSSSRRQASSRCTFNVLSTRSVPQAPSISLRYLSPLCRRRRRRQTNYIEYGPCTTDYLNYTDWDTDIDSKTVWTVLPPSNYLLPPFLVIDYVYRNISHLNLCYFIFVITIQSVITSIKILCCTKCTNMTCFYYLLIYCRGFFKYTNINTIKDKHPPYS